MFLVQNMVNILDLLAKSDQWMWPSMLNLLSDLYISLYVIRNTWKASYLKQNIIKGGSVGQGGVFIDAVDGKLCCHTGEGLSKQWVTSPRPHHPNPKPSCLHRAGYQTEENQNQQDDALSARQVRRKETGNIHWRWLSWRLALRLLPNQWQDTTELLLWLHVKCNLHLVNPQMAGDTTSTRASEPLQRVCKDQNTKWKSFQGLL